MTDSDRYEPMPSLLELPAWVLRKLPRRARIAVVVAMVVLVAALVVVLVAVLLPAASRRADRQRTAERRDLARRLAEVRRIQRPQRLRLPAAARRSPRASVQALQRAIAARAGTGSAVCDPLPGRADVFACGAIRARVGSSVLTIPFAARIDRGVGEAFFCRRVYRNGVPTEAELSSYRVPAACGGG